MSRQQNNRILNLGYLSVVAFFLLFIFLPAVYILINSGNWQSYFSALVFKAIAASFLVGIVVILVDLAVGVPLAYLLVRSKNKIVRVIDNLVDLSLVMPTAALGFSVFIYWGSRYGVAGLFGLDGLVSKGLLLIILLHIIFTLPYVVRSTAAAFLQIDSSREEAAETLGANPFTLFRTISLPLARDGIINGAILAFTRSLSETGATMMVAGAYVTAPVLVISLKDQGRLSEATGVSIVLILIAIFILLAAKRFLGERVIKIEKIYPDFEKRLSTLGPLKNYSLMVFFAIFILLPTIYINLYYIANASLFGLSGIIRSISLSLVLAVVVTFINTIFSIPMAYLIARNWLGCGKILDSLSEIVLLMPTSALGLSLALFWRQFISPEYLILALAHLSFTFPLLVKPIVSSVRNIPVSQEEAAYVSGANKFVMFSTIILPQIKPAIVAGIIMAFMRSVSETGATLAVTNKIETASILIVNAFKDGRSSVAALTCVIMFLAAFGLLVILKKTQRK